MRNARFANLHIEASLNRQTRFGSPFNAAQRIPSDGSLAGSPLHKGVEDFP